MSVDIHGETKKKPIDYKKLSTEAGKQQVKSEELENKSMRPPGWQAEINEKMLKEDHEAYAEETSKDGTNQVDKGPQMSIK
jgi:hypothetical protein